MSTDYPKGGYAFADGASQHPTPKGYERQYGMTLRDYFAGQALAGLISTGKTPSAPKFKGQTGSQWFASEAYGYADAMLAEREKGGDA